jgi:hypothetical protein
MNEGYWEFEKGLPHCLVKVAYVELTGDLASGVLLSQLVYWFKPAKNGQPRLKVMNAKGELVLAKRREDWYSECGITLKQYKRAIKTLQDLGLVRVTHAQFNGAPTTHIWLDVPLLSQLVAGGSIGPKGTVPLGPKGPNDWAQKDQSLIYTEITAGTTAVTEKTAAEILKDFQGKTKKGIEGIGFNSMVMLWKKRMSLYTPNFVKELTGVEKGQLKHAYKTLGEDALPVLDRVLSDWGEFANAVAVEKNEQVSKLPTCGSFCKHFEIGLHLLKTPKKAPVAPSVILVKPNNLGHTSEQPVTQEDIAATLQMLKALQGK